MNARMLIADLIPPLQDGMYPSEDVADNILAAMPEILRADPSILRGMVKPLVWDTDIDGTFSTDAVYEIIQDASSNYYFAHHPTDFVGLDFPSDGAAIIAANAHHADAVLSAMGVV